MNVWILLIEKRINSTNERALGPFTSVFIEGNTITDGLTGAMIVRRDPNDCWIQGDGRTGRFDRIVVQQGGWTNPWGERGA